MRPVQTLAILTLVLLAHLSPPPAGAKDEHKILLGEPWKNGKNGDSPRFSVPVFPVGTIYR